MFEIQKANCVFAELKIKGDKAVIRKQLEELGFSKDPDKKKTISIKYSSHDSNRSIEIDADLQCGQVTSNPEDSVPVLREELVQKIGDLFEVSFWS